MPANKKSDAAGYQVTGANPQAPFTLKIHRGEGMALLAMNWKGAKPPRDFVGFAIAYKEPKGERFFTLKNRLSFQTDMARADPSQAPRQFPTTLAPIQKFRWVHFPRNADMEGEFVYRVTPVFMNRDDELSYGEYQEAAIRLARHTYPRKVNVAFTRGFVASQAFTDRYMTGKTLAGLLPAKAADGLDFKSTHPRADEALAWMGFEARSAIKELLEDALKDKADVYLIAYDLSLPEIVGPLVKLKKKVKAIIDDSKEHGEAHSGESQAAARLSKSAGAGRVKRQHMGQLQHNKIIIVDGPKVKRVLCGSTNYSWRGFYVQSNNALILEGAKPVALFKQAFDNYWNNESSFGSTDSAFWSDAGVSGVGIDITFSPHGPENRVSQEIADDIAAASTSVFYSLAFLNMIQAGPIRTAIEAATKDKDLFVYGISDKRTQIELLKPDGNPAPVFSAALKKNLPEPFRSEVTGGMGTRMHHKFIVLDFNTDDARVYLGSFNFSKTADEKNGENLVYILDRRIATAYMVEALRIFDHYHFRVSQQEAKKARKKLVLKRPPREAGEKPWWAKDYAEPAKVRDRKLFA